MKYSCDIILDLLPLYIDDVASPSSRQMVEEHLAECADCRNMLSCMKNDEAENALTAEKENVIAEQRRSFKRKSAVAGSVIAGIFMIPVLVCLIVNLAVGSGLDWFFIVLASLLVAASVSIVPLMVPENKGLWTLGSFTVTLLLLFGVCCLYTGGSWFFVAATAVLFGLAVVFLPFVARSRVLSGYLEGRKGLAVMAADTALYVVMMLAIGLHSKTPGFFPVAAAISIPIILIAWAVFAILRYGMKIGTKQDSPDRQIGEAAGTASQTRPEYRPVRKTEEPKRSLQAWEIVLLALGSPLWIALLIVAFAVLLTVYIAVWAVIVSLWAADLSFAAGGIGGVVLGIVLLCQGNGLQGAVTICAGLVLAGLSVFLFFGCREMTKGAVALTKTIASWVKARILRKENSK